VKTNSLVASSENSAILLSGDNESAPPLLNDRTQANQLFESEAKDNEPQAGFLAASQPTINSGVTESVIQLDSVLNIQNVAYLHERLLNALDNNSRVLLDASAVTVADTASLQLLLILKRTAIKLQKEVVIDFPSDRFIEAADLLGISEMLEVDQAAAGLF
jgi:anti-anti-sigma regulatory factor